jgi:hypothetical protein
VGPAGHDRIQQLKLENMKDDFEEKIARAEAEILKNRTDMMT